MFWLEIVFPSDVFAKKITGYKVIQRWFLVSNWLKVCNIEKLMRKNDVTSLIFSCFESERVFNNFSLAQFYSFVHSAPKLTLAHQCRCLMNKVKTVRM